VHFCFNFLYVVTAENRSAIESETSLTNNPSLMKNLPKSLIIDPSNIEVGSIIGQGILTV